MRDLQKKLPYVALFVLFSSLCFAQYLGPVGSWSTPMQQTLRAAPTTGTSPFAPGIFPGAAAMPSGGLTARERSNISVAANQYSMPAPLWTGYGYAGLGMNRGIARGIRF